jgi:hypothetical protein
MQVVAGMTRSDLPERARYRVQVDNDFVTPGVLRLDRTVFRAA